MKDCVRMHKKYLKKTTTGNIPDFNDLVWLMKDNKTCLKYDPYSSGSFTTLIPCKGV